MNTDGTNTQQPDDVTAEVVDALAAAGLVDCRTPLYESVEMDALDRLVRHARLTGTTVSVSFEHEGHAVRVTNDDGVRVDVARSSADD